MNCRDLDHQLTPYLDGELIDEARLGVEGHLATCETCRRHVEIERHNLLAIRQAARAASPVVPDAFKAKLFENLRHDANRRSRLTVQRVAALAAGVTVIALAGHQGWRVHQRRLYEQDAVGRHARQFPLEVQGDGVEQWFGGKLDHRVTVPHFPNARVAGARLLQVRDKPAAYIRYEGDRPQATPVAARGSMGLFVYGDDNQDVDVGAEPALGSSHGYNVVSWRRGDVVYQLVTDLDEADIRDLVPATAPTNLETPEVQPASLRR